jgi:chemotaxis protein methyltransferase CheR
MTRHSSPPAVARPDGELVRPLAPEEFDQIRLLAHRSFGLDLKAGKEELVASRLGKLVRSGGFRTFHEYYRHLVQDTTGRALAGMIDALTTNHTAFLREPGHFDYLQREVVPSLARRGHVEIWCAACSTGEEVWTLACLLADTLGSRRFQITATDISTRALRAAETAEYAADRCTCIPPSWVGRYFQRVNEGSAFRICPALRAQAVFRRVNLIEPQRWPQRFPVIFCRNVMIYFDAPTQERVIAGLTQWLEPGGHLFVGHAESLSRISHSLEYVQPAIYRKPAEHRSRWNQSS